MLGFAGVTVMDTSVAAVTVSDVVPDILPTEAVIVLAPAEIDVASPFDPAELPIVATLVLEDAQVDDAVRS